jgi:hypothetical protein
VTEVAERHGDPLAGRALLRLAMGSSIGIACAASLLVQGVTVVSVQ